MVPIVHAPILKTALCADEAATERLAQRLAAQPELAHAYLSLHGELGAGKTTLVRHLLRALGVSGRIKSPTYAVVEAYEPPWGPIWHFDFYRLNDPREWEDAGFREIFASPGLKLAEWPEKVAGCAPTADLALHLQVLDDERRSITASAHSPLGERLLAAWD